MVSAVDDLVRADGTAAAVTTVVAHTGAVPWFGRDAAETLALDADTGLGDAPRSTDGDEAELSVDAIVTALAGAGIDGVWLGRVPTSAGVLALTQACEQAGMAVAGPSSEALRRLAEPAPQASDTTAERTDTDTGRRARLVDVDVLASADRVLTLPRVTSWHSTTATPCSRSSPPLGCRRRSRLRSRTRLRASCVRRGSRADARCACASTTPVRSPWSAWTPRGGPTRHYWTKG
ncbi:hypothetical protein GCM10025883_36430 [Mobilicoccus caccae]|uniref:Uncharacterized protein n=1 Tax=Mobilicoccus caccae TaxID=1859295 RepID=A0ABQ6IY46_9MICO|nr:hypothetical protein GCM10025883_36430 [Mobilicoccus caccae]